MSEIIFEVREDEVEGGFTASALGVGIHTEADSVEQLRVNVREAVDSYFDETMEAPPRQLIFQETNRTSSAAGSRG